MRHITLAIAFLICTAAEAQVIRAEPFYIAPNEVSGNLLLDDYPGAETAYSMRKLDKDYTGSAIRVRRSSDNTEQDIGFVNNYLDTTSLKTFVGNNSGFVTTWYNQADSSGVFGTKNATQTTAANQPRIINSGAFELSNLKPCLYFDGSNDFMQRVANTSQSGEIFFVSEGSGNSEPCVSQANNQSLTDFIHIITTGNFPEYNYSQRLSTSGNILYGTTNTLNKQSVISWRSNSSAVNMAVNNIAQTTTAFQGSNTGQWLGDFNYSFTIMALIRSSAVYRLGDVQELIIYNSEQSNRSGIFSNINSFYSIY